MLATYLNGFTKRQIKHLSLFVQKGGIKMNTYTIYMHKNKINGKVYIGQTCQLLNQRWKNGNGYREETYFGKAIKKYGWDNFEHIILEENISEDEVDEKEIYYINYYKSTDENFGYNLESGGKHHLHSEYTKNKMRESAQKRIEKNIEKYNSKVSDETREKISKALKGVKRQPRSKETKEKLSKANKGKKRPQISKAKKEYYESHTFSDEQIEKIREKAIGNQNRAIKIGMYDTEWNLIKEFKSIKVAMEYTNSKTNWYINQARKKNVLFNGYYWKDIE